MAKVKFIRLAEVINKKQDKRVMSVSIKPTLYDCTGMIWFTDIQLQEGPVLNGYAPHTESRLEKLKEDGSIKNPVWFNGVVRSEETIILFNVGETSAGLDIHVYPKLSMSAGTVKLSQGIGGQQVSFPGAIGKDVDLALLASTRECTKNGASEPKEGFYQYSAAWDSKHKVTLEKGKSARVLFTMQEMQDGGEPF
ncbi:MULTISPECIES: hypothetical protein [Enterococcus]|uniref:hypothetical protein n=1 Tax=Enterococcus TaxID=1350 RepID=UPI0022DECAF6|nr:hypothetical protein [Enterococcus lactis]